MRVGAVTHRGYGALVLQRYGPAWGWFGAADLTLTNLVTLVAEFVSIRVGLAYFHLGSGVAVALGLALVVFTLSSGRYWRWERITLGLAAFNGLFLLAAVLVRPRAGAVVSSLDFMPFPGGSVSTLLLLLASTVGVTVRPWSGVRVRQQAFGCRVRDCGAGHTVVSDLRRCGSLWNVRCGSERAAACARDVERDAGLEKLRADFAVLQRQHTVLVAGRHRKLFEPARRPGL